MILDYGKHYVYRHIRLDKNEPFYIGIGTKSEKNDCLSNYKRSYDKKYRNKIWKNIVKKSEIKIEILIESDDYDFIKEKEKEFINLYGRINKDNGSLSNLTDGGDGAINSVVSSETKKRLSNCLKGRKLTKETIEKRVKNWKRINKDGYKEVSKKLSKAVLQYSLDGNLIKEWESITETSKFGFLIARVSDCCNKKRLTHKGFIWKFKTKTMTLQTAIGMLEKAKDVYEWNEIREQIKIEVGPEVWLDEYMPTIDGSGLIVQVLKQHTQEN